MKICVKHSRESTIRRQRLSEINFESRFSTMNCSDAADCFTYTIGVSSTPKKKKWITEGILQLIKQKQELYRLWKKDTQNEAQKQEYKFSEM